MTAAQITEKVRAIVAEQLGVELYEVTPDASLVDDLGCDSLDRIELGLAIEEEFGLTEIPDDEIAQMTTIRHIHEYLAVHAR